MPQSWDFSLASKQDQKVKTVNPLKSLLHHSATQLVIRNRITSFSYSHIIYKAGIGHLLQVDSCWHFSVGLSLYDPMFNHVLQICKPSPDVT